MFKSLFLFFVLFFCSNQLSAQVPKFQMGLATGNLLTFANGAFNDELQPGNLIRYKVSLLFRSRLTDQFKLPKPFPKTKKGVAALDYGLSLVANGYSYQYRGIEHYRDQWILEFPLLFVFYDRSDFWMSKKLRRKGFATFARMGFKGAYIFSGKTNNSSSSTEYRLSEQGEYGGFNLYWSVGGGLLRTSKSGHTTSISISGNIGWFKRTQLQLNYEDQAGRLEEETFTSQGSYVDLEVIYLFFAEGKRKNFGKKPPLIFNPRY